MFQSRRDTVIVWISRLIWEVPTYCTIFPSAVFKSSFFYRNLFDKRMASSPSNLNVASGITSRPAPESMRQAHFNEPMNFNSYCSRIIIVRWYRNTHLFGWLYLKSVQRIYTWIFILFIFFQCSSSTFQVLLLAYSLISGHSLREWLCLHFGLRHGGSNFGDR